MVKSNWLKAPQIKLTTFAIKKLTREIKEKNRTKMVLSKSKQE